MTAEEELRQANKLQASAINILISAYWKLYYEQASFPGVDAVRRIESEQKKWSKS